MTKLLIIADDFTGALDTGAQFAKHGVATYVVEASRFDMQQIPADTEVLVIDAQTRHIPAAQAYSNVKKLVTCGQDAGIPYLYIKVDSTLRGNIGAYLAAAIDARGGDVTCVLAPAFPPMKRATKNGRQYIGDRPLDETEIMNDPFTPVCSSYIPELLAKQTDIQSRHIKAERLRGIDLKNTRREILVVDAQTQDDLLQIAEELVDRPQVVLSGSAGLADVLAVCIQFKNHRELGETRSNRIFVLSGSLNVHSVRQILQAEKEGVTCIVMNEKQKQDALYIESGNGQSFAKFVAQKLVEKGKLILCAADEFAFERVSKKQANGIREHLLVAENIGKISKAVIEDAAADTIIVFGGDTLFGLLEAMNVSGLVPQKELLPGVVLSKADFAGRTIQIVTKAGGFGEVDTLVSIINQLSSEQTV